MPSAPSLPKVYAPQTVEQRWYAEWERLQLFHSVPDEREPYTILIPPPNITGVLHMGHMLNNTLQDVLIRRKRMEGYNACWVPGTDHASIATEAKVVQLIESEGHTKQSLGRDAFLTRAFEWKERYGDIILEQLTKLGASCDWSRTRFTMEDALSRQVIRAFVQLHNDGLIYRGKRMVNWDPAGQTALSDEEVNHREVDGQLYHIRYPLLDDPQQALTIATTRPETILADTAIAVNPADERYQHLIGQQALVPLIDRPVPIIADEYVEQEFGTGALKVTPANDENDYNIGLRHELPIIEILNLDGTLTEAAQRYVGEDRMAVRPKIAEELRDKGYLEKTEPLRHSVGFSERTEAVVEPMLSNQWFVAMEKLAQPALEAVLGEEPSIRFIPDRFKNTYRHWLENIRDWCISRQLWWGHRIPAYYYGEEGDYVVAETREEAFEQAKANGFSGTAEDLRQDPDVLDTWFSSWLWPISVFDGLLEPDNDDITYYYPTNDLVTGPDIIFFWVARMIMAGEHFRGEAPFRHVYFTSIIRDAQRRKMSKSLGNSPDVLKLIDQYGADSLRMGILMSTSAGNDLLFDESVLETGRNFCNKIWNVLRFLKGLPAEQMTGADEPTPEEAHALAWLTARIERVKAELEDHYAQFRILDISRSLYRLIWNDFCSTYIELFKPAKGDSFTRAAYEATLDRLEELMKLLHPLTPFITEEVYQNLRPRTKGDSICVARVEPAGPPPGADERIAAMQHALDIVTELRNFRSTHGLGEREPLNLQARSSHPQSLEEHAHVLRKLAHIAELELVQTEPAEVHQLVVGSTELFIPAAAVPVDTEAEAQRLREEISYTEGFRKKVEKKLANEKFVANAPPEVVERERQKLHDAEEKLQLLKDSLTRLGA